MKSLLSIFFTIVIVVALTGNNTFAQSVPEKTDSSVIAQIKDQEMNHSQVMDILGYLTDVYGPRLTGSPGYFAAATWAKEKLASWDLANSHFEGWGPFGRGWTLKHYSANVVGSQTFPLISYPKAWSPGTDGIREGEIVFLDVSTDSALETYRGKLHGRFVMIGPTREVKAHFTAEVSRHSDSTLLDMANMDPFPKPRRRFELSPAQKARSLVNYHRLKMCIDEGAVGILTPSFGDGGNMMFIQGAAVPNHPDTPFVHSIQSYNASAPKIIPQIGVGIEHYNRLVRMIQKGEHPKLALELDVEFNKADSVYNVIAEIPGTDLKDEVVMIGGHLDSWHGATGATDNGTGSAVSMEAMRILKSLNLKPRRTIRIGLWSGEEQGEFGSTAYVRQHFVQKGQPDTGAVKLSPEGEKFSVYFNNDYGTGKVRGVFTDGNEGSRPVFRKWFAPFKELGASTIDPSPLPIGGSDHEAFEDAGLPGFQFIQDDIEYFTRSWHSTTDLYERALPEDLQQATIIMAAFAYDAAMRDQLFPRKQKPLPQTAGGTH